MVREYLRGRSTADTVVLLFTSTVCTILVLTTVAVILTEMIHPETNTHPVVEMEMEIIQVLVGALVGFIGGRGLGRAETHDELKVLDATMREREEETPDG